MLAVVKPFAFSLDGFTRIDLDIGDVREDFGSHTEGLIAEGYVEPFAAPAVVIPATVPTPAVVPPAVEPAVEPVVADAPALFAAVQPDVKPAPVRRKRK
jgi:hypothetical protein